ncbi:ankyrin repeat domain-containing protein [Corynebacterium halotolerans]|uniref:Uncharacterized protein n=1 Tax=Corynebacterium halotolerans YIM 70093 = DSM 44683 TaxID=1121362 RepID=M1MZN4_9CORY|nr:ankyrin repeat domain-containing protein [Corynebacterium halotolerans]AGF73174.1 hypothetical protein A605_10870 [Corynebacterium halotolerans YIM 70093 = DSM 44683]
MTDIPQDVQELATQLFDMARKGHQDLLEIIDQGLNVDLMNQEGNTLLMLAAYNGQPTLVRGLIERGADINKLNDRAQSPLAGAIFKKENEVVDVLIDAGADPTIGHPTAVDCARMFGRDDLLGRLGVEE